MLLRSKLWLTLVCLLSVAAVAAQPPDNCPVIVNDAFDVLDDNCASMDRNTACYGYSLVSAEFTENVEPGFFSDPADLADLNVMQSINTASLDTERNLWGVVVMKVPQRSSRDAQKICDALQQNKIGLLITVNECGLDAGGTISRFCASEQIVHANWCVDDPLFSALFYHTQIRSWKYRVDFVSDRASVADLAKKGVQAFFLPLGTDETLFRPEAGDPSPIRRICFVGNSYYALLFKELAVGLEHYLESIALLLSTVLEKYQADVSLDVEEELRIPLARYPLPDNRTFDQLLFIARHTVGFLYRKKLVSELCNRYDDFMVFGDKYWPLFVPRERVSRKVGYYTNLCETYRQTQVNVDSNRVVIRDGCTQRVFDTLAAESFVITSNKPVIHEFFETTGQRREISVFYSFADFLEKTAFYVTHEKECRAIAHRGRKKVLGEHTYRHRITSMCRTIREATGMIVPLKSMKSEIGNV